MKRVVCQLVRASYNGNSNSGLCLDNLIQQHKHQAPGRDEYRSDDESGDEYKQQDATKKPRRKKSRRTEDDDGTSSKKRKRKGKQVYDVQDLNDLPPEQGECEIVVLQSVAD